MNVPTGKLKYWFCGFWLMMAATVATAAPLLDTGNPLGFFTNVASRLLASELNRDFTRIQVYPTNQYTPAVHRLLQVAANVYEATSTNYYPAVFRPLFSREADGYGTNVFITGYQYVRSVSGLTDTNLASPIDVNALAGIGDPVTNLPVNVYNAPWIIGVRKGFPNFNQFVVENVLGVTRRLQLTRKTNAPPMLTGTNQMYLFDLNSSLGVEMWNSYSSNYSGTVSCVLREKLSVVLTNDDPGFGAHPGVAQPMLIGYANAFFTNLWPGSAYYLPLNATALLLTNSVYRSPYAGLTGGTVPVGFAAPCLVPTNYYGIFGAALFETNTPGFPFPHWGLLTTNQLQALLLDYDSTNDNYHVIDYVHLQTIGSQDINAALFADTLTDTEDGINDGVWNTNINPVSGVPYGIQNQINISRGLPGFTVPPLEDGNWSSDFEAGKLGPTIIRQQHSFLAFFLPYGVNVAFTENGMTVVVSNLMSSVVAPYSPRRRVVTYTVLEANDPLVHYLASDLSPSYPLNLPAHVDPDGVMLTLSNLNLGQLNKNYQPWGGNPLWGYVIDPNRYNLALKDPGIKKSDRWNFPTNAQPGGDWLGQVNRGTPWQTLYLKAANILDQTQVAGGATNYIGTNTWMKWTGDTNAADAVAMAPVRDRHLVGLLAYLLNTNDLPPLFSVNNPNPDSWQMLLDGMTALTNNLTDTQIRLGLIPPQFDTLIITSNSPQASAIASAIQNARASQPNQYFREVGDILAIPQLSEQSPYLNWTSSIQQTNGITDEAYEKIPGQLLPLLRADSIGSIAPINGQMQVEFTGYDGEFYAVQVSSNLVSWVSLSTNVPANGSFSVTVSPEAGAGAQFYRSVLLQ